MWLLCLCAGFPTGNGEQLSNSQSELSLAINSAVAYFPSIPCGASCARAWYLKFTPHSPSLVCKFLFQQNKKYPRPTPITCFKSLFNHFVSNVMSTTVLVRRMPHRKWRESKQHLSLWTDFALLGSCLVSLHFLWSIQHTNTVDGIDLTKDDYHFRC